MYCSVGDKNTWHTILSPSATIKVVLSLCIHTCIPTYIHTCMYTYIHTCMHTYIHVYIHTVHTYIHSYIHAYIYACILSILTYMHTVRSPFEEDLGVVHVDIPPEKQNLGPFQHFRVRMTGSNEGSSCHMYCSGIELFGCLLQVERA
jgi:hypothetical protein